MIDPRGDLMTWGNDTHLLIAMWASEERLACQTGADQQRHHASEDLDAARARRYRRPRRARRIVGRIRQALAR